MVQRNVVTHGETSWLNTLLTLITIALAFFGGSR